MKTSWVLDTNVLVSGILTPHGYPGRLVNSVLSGALRLTVDDRILIEYRQVLSRAKFGFPAEQVNAVMALLMRQDLVVPTPLPVDLPDLDDLPFLETAQFATDRVLVTGNTKHYPKNKRHGVEVLSPAQAWPKLVGR